MALVGYYGPFSMALATRTPLGLRPPTTPASMGGETPGNNYPAYFFPAKTSTFRPAVNYGQSTWIGDLSLANLTDLTMKR